MGWKQCAIAYGRPYETLCDGVSLLTLKGAAGCDVALFTRTTADRRWRVLLLSPAAVDLADGALSDQWSECEAPELFDWDIVVGTVEACERLGLRRPRFRQREAPLPYVFGDHARQERP
jgi:hypothetical protein